MEGKRGEDGLLGRVRGIIRRLLCPVNDIRMVSTLSLLRFLERTIVVSNAMLVAIFKDGLCAGEESLVSRA